MTVQGEYRYGCTLSLTSAVDRDGWLAPISFHPREIPGAHCIGGWVGPRADLDGCGRACHPPGFDLRTIQPVASRYTD